jgi:mannose-6-phosphate isomerase
MCIEGRFKISYQNNKVEKVEKGETIMIPAILKNLVLIPEGSAKIIEVYIPVS